MKISKQRAVGEILLCRRLCLLHQELLEAGEWLTPEDKNPFILQVMVRD